MLDVSIDPHCHDAGGPPQRHPFLLLRGRHLPGLLFLRLDCARALPCQGMQEGKGAANADKTVVFLNIVIIMLLLQMIKMMWVWGPEKGTQ